jgi:hypothetical protein
VDLSVTARDVSVEFDDLQKAARIADKMYGGSALAYSLEDDFPVVKRWASTVKIVKHDVMCEAEQQMWRKLVDTNVTTYRELQMRVSHLAFIEVFKVDVINKVAYLHYYSDNVIQHRNTAYLPKCCAHLYYWWAVEMSKIFPIKITFN